jgi:hypothetical protein
VTAENLPRWMTDSSLRELRLPLVVIQCPLDCAHWLRLQRRGQELSLPVQGICASCRAALAGQPVVLDETLEPGDFEC